MYFVNNCVYKRQIQETKRQDMQAMLWVFKALGSTSSSIDRQILASYYYYYYPYDNNQSIRLQQRVDGGKTIHPRVSKGLTSKESMHLLSLLEDRRRVCGLEGVQKKGRKFFVWCARKHTFCCTQYSVEQCLELK